MNGSTTATATHARTRANSRDDLVMWVIYDHPSDHPETFIARKWLIGRGRMTATQETLEQAQVEELRRHFHQLGLVRLKRDPTDDPVIIETWM